MLVFQGLFCLELCDHIMSKATLPLSVRAAALLSVPRALAGWSAAAHPRVDKSHISDSSQCM